MNVCIFFTFYGLGREREGGRERERGRKGERERFVFPIIYVFIG